MIFSWQKAFLSFHDFYQTTENKILRNKKETKSPLFQVVSERLTFGPFILHGCFPNYILLAKVVPVHERF